MDQQKYIERKDIDVTLIDENEDNPNRMSARAFDLLVDNIAQQGITEDIVVRPLGDGRYRCYSGHHRLRAAVYLGYEAVPCAINTDPAFDDEREMFQLVRMNAIRGKLDAQSFYELYQKYAGKYGDEMLQDLFGFADDAEFKRLIASTAKGLPPELKSKFKEAAKEVKTIDGLAAVLNDLFTRYGNTVPFGFMVFDYGKQNHIWIEISKKTFDALDLLGDLCVEESVTMDTVLGGLIQAAAKGEASEILRPVVEGAPKVVMPAAMPVLPTKGHIEKMEGLSAEED